MSIPPSRHTRRRYVSLAGLLAFIAAIAVITAWFHEESKWNARMAAVMLVAFAIAAVVVSMSSPSLTAASIRLAVGSALLLASVAWALTSPTSVGWQYHSVFHWAAYWALATVVLPVLAGPGLGRIWAASRRQEWVDRLRQVPAGFLLFLLTILLSLAIGFVLDVVLPPPAPMTWTGSRGRLSISPPPALPRAR
jgi:peptidoglycan/LPS O-acetylase OafA/YrhL